MNDQPLSELRLFEGFGVELEYMIVDKGSLTVRPISDQIIHAITGSYEIEVERGPFCWSNELVLHVIELKVHPPAAHLESLPDAFQAEVAALNGLLTSHDAMLLPTAMHPLMDPVLETRLWPHEQSEIYETFDRIFNCKGHGWSNLQSCHLNLPFGSDEEFGRLHAAIRLVLPLIPMLAASSPIEEGRVMDTLDTRLRYYQTNCQRLPSVTGRVIPECVYTQRDYEEQVLVPIAQDYAPFDTLRVLEAKWVNARGAIARFDRGSIEIRLVDIQECPEADLAILAFLVALIRGLVEETWLSSQEQRLWEAAALEQVLLDGVRRGSQAELPADYLRALGLRARQSQPAARVLPELVDRLTSQALLSRQWQRTLRVLSDEGTLAERILRVLGPSPTRDNTESVYRRLASCLAAGQLFHS